MTIDLPFAFIGVAVELVALYLAWTKQRERSMMVMGCVVFPWIIAYMLKTH